MGCPVGRLLLQKILREPLKRPVFPKWWVQPVYLFHVMGSCIHCPVLILPKNKPWTIRLQSKSTIWRSHLWSISGFWQSAPFALRYVNELFKQDLIVPLNYGFLLLGFFISHYLPIPVELSWELYRLSNFSVTDLCFIDLPKPCQMPSKEPFLLQSGNWVSFVGELN